MTELRERFGNAMGVVGDAAIEVVFGDEFRCGECDTQGN
jgi:hypothetical protein